MLSGANGGKFVISRRPRQEAEGQQQCQRPEARHDEVDVASLGVARFTVVRHDQRPGNQRHEFPTKQIRKRVTRQHHKIHSCQKGGEEGQHALRRLLMMTVTETIEACRGPSEIDDDEKKRSQPVEAEMSTKPRQSDWKGQIGGVRRTAKQPVDGPNQRNRRRGQRRAIDNGRGDLCAAQKYCQHRQSKQSGNTRHLQNDSRHYVRAFVPLDALFSIRLFK